MSPSLRLQDSGALMSFLRDPFLGQAACPQHPNAVAPWPLSIVLP